MKVVPIATTVVTKFTIIVSDENDPFYKESMYLNYGDLTDKFQKWKNINQKLNNHQLII